MKYHISINPFAEFSVSTLAAQKRIIKQQLTPNKLLIPWYQLAKSSLKRYFANVEVLTPINEAIEILSKKVPENKRQLTDKIVSIEALKKVSAMEKPKILSEIKYELIKSSFKDIEINDVNITIAPDVIIKGTYKGFTVYGAIKFHVSKSKPFDLNQASIVSTLLYKFLENKFSGPHERALPELCLCLDVFSERIVPAPKNLTKQLAVIKNICENIKQVWPKTA